MMLLCSIFHFFFSTPASPGYSNGLGAQFGLGLTLVRSQLLATSDPIHNFQVRIHYFATRIIREAVRRAFHLIH